MRNIFIYIICILIFISSCTNDDNSIPEGRSLVSFEVIENDENRVSTVDILAFRVDENDVNKEYFAYRAEGQDIVDDKGSNKKRFKVTLLKDDIYKYRFVILANSRKEVNDLGDISKTALKSELLHRLVSHRTQKWIINSSDPDYADIPMWTETQQIYIDNTTASISGLYLVRMLARVDVSIDPSIQSKFKLKSVHVYNYNTYGQIVPLTDASYWDGKSILKPTIPSIPGKTWNPLLYDKLTIADVSITHQIYLYESAAVSQDLSSEATCLVIGGEYDNEGDVTYYRVNFSKTDNNGNTSFVDILRYNLYSINISDVKVKGFKTPDEAFNSQVIALTADIKVWEQAGVSDFKFEGHYSMQVSQSYFKLSLNTRTVSDWDNKLYIKTDYPEGWHIEKIVGSDGTPNGVGWLSLSQYTGLANENSTVSLLTEENATEIDRTAYIYIKAGRFIYVVEVLQTTVPELSMIYTDTSGNEISELLFYSHVGGTVPPQQLNIDWVPKDKYPVVVNYPIPGFTYFDFGSGDVIRPGYILVTTGQKSYTIQPPPMTQSEVDANSFLEKAIRVDITITNNVAYESKRLFIYQKNYAAVPTVNNTYAMDGNEQYFLMKANAPWKIEVTRDVNNVIQELKTKTGGQYEDKRVEYVYFTPVDDMVSHSIGNSDVTFTIKSTNANRPFPDKTFLVNFTSLAVKK